VRIEQQATTLHDLLIQLRITNRLLAAQLRDKMKQTEVISLLASVGASARDIAAVLDTTAATVQNALSRLKKE
jgi:CRP-like cAMP-binding protein